MKKKILLLSGHIQNKENIIIKIKKTLLQKLLYIFTFRGFLDPFQLFLKLQDSAPRQWMTMLSMLYDIGDSVAKLLTFLKILPNGFSI